MIFYGYRYGTHLHLLKSAAAWISSIFFLAFLPSDPYLRSIPTLLWQDLFQVWGGFPGVGLIYHQGFLWRSTVGSPDLAELMERAMEMYWGRGFFPNGLKLPASQRLVHLKKGCFPKPGGEPPDFQGLTFQVNEPFKLRNFETKLLTYMTHTCSYTSIWKWMKEFHFIQKFRNWAFNPYVLPMGVSL